MAKTWTLDEVRELVIQLFPEGTLYDWYNTASIVYAYLDGVAQALLTYCLKKLDVIRAETNPATAVQKLPDWEAALALTTTYSAIKGTIAQRQAAVLGKLREFAAFTPSAVQAFLAPVLGYANPQQLLVVETSRVNLRAAHTYFDYVPDGGFISTAGFPPLVRTIAIPDGGTIGRAGAQLTIWLTHPTVEALRVTLTAPGGRSKTWTNLGVGSVTIQGFLLWGAEFVGSQAGPLWTLTISSTAQTGFGSLVQWSLFTEGYGTGGLGSDIFYWGAYADPTLVGGSGAAPDYGAAERVITRVQHAHTLGHVLRSFTPTPDAPLSIPDHVLPA